MRIHLLSDLHNEFKVYEPTETAKASDVVILAGDIDVKARGVEWAKSVFDKPVLYVAGNHEYYKGHLEKTLSKMRELTDGQVHVLENDEVILNGVRFLGTTGWSDFSATGNQPLAELEALQSMNDFKRIRTDSNYRKTRPSDFSSRNHRAKRWLEEKLSEPFNGKTVVITHYAPSSLSLDSRRSLSHLDAAYINRWEELVSSVNVWVHGHTHFRTAYDIGDSHVYSNPRGYPGEKTGFDPDLIIEL